MKLFKKQKTSIMTHPIRRPLVPMCVLRLCFDLSMFVGICFGFVWIFEGVYILWLENNLLSKSIVSYGLGLLQRGFGLHGFTEVFLVPICFLDLYSISSGQPSQPRSQKRKCGNPLTGAGLAAFWYNNHSSSLPSYFPPPPPHTPPSFLSSHTSLHM